MNCCFCDKCPESMVHFYWEGHFVKGFWHDLCLFIVNNIDESFEIFWKKCYLVYSRKLTKFE